MAWVARCEFRTIALLVLRLIEAQYLTPALYTYEIIMAMEFHGREFTCAEGSIVPLGPNYQNPAFQGCAYRGVESGSLTLNGDAYIAQEFGFSFSNVGRDFVILFVFFFGLLIINMLLSESIDWTARVHGGGSVDRNPINCDRPKLPILIDEDSLSIHQITK